MDTQPRFHRAEVVEQNTLIRPQSADRNGDSVGRPGIFGASEGEVTDEEVAKVDETESWESLVCDPCIVEDIDDIGRPHKLPRSYRKPTKQEVLDHLPSHWPFRSWCKHCLAGRAAGSHHKARSDEDKEFARNGVPTISLDHCFLGSEDDAETAHASP